MPINNNDILKRLRFTFSLEDAEMISLFQNGGFTTDRAAVSNWLKKEEDADFIELNDFQLAAFLNGLIILKRGAKDENPMQPEEYLSNNDILKKLKIALSLSSEELIQLFESKGRKVSKGELSNFLRNSNHPKYIPLQAQYLRNLLQAIQDTFTKK
jgi:uncharacterized protein YehS (DUF1456 family)